MLSVCYIVCSPPKVKSSEASFLTKHPSWLWMAGGLQTPFLRNATAEATSGSCCFWKWGRERKARNKVEGGRNGKVMQRCSHHPPPQPGRKISDLNPNGGGEAKKTPGRAGTSVSPWATSQKGGGTEKLSGPLVRLGAQLAWQWWRRVLRQ